MSTGARPDTTSDESKVWGVSNPKYTHTHNCTKSCTSWYLRFTGSEGYCKWCTNLSHKNRCDEASFPFSLGSSHDRRRSSMDTRTSCGCWMSWKRTMTRSATPLWCQGRCHIFWCADVGQHELQWKAYIDWIDCLDFFFGHLLFVRISTWFVTTWNLTCTRWSVPTSWKKFTSSGLLRSGTTDSFVRWLAMWFLSCRLHFFPKTTGAVHQSSTVIY